MVHIALSLHAQAIEAMVNPSLPRGITGLMRSHAPDAHSLRNNPSGIVQAAVAVAVDTISAQAQDKIQRELAIKVCLHSTEGDNARSFSDSHSRGRSAKNSAARLSGRAGRPGPKHSALLAHTLTMRSHMRVRSKARAKKKNRTISVTTTNVVFSFKIKFGGRSSARRLEISASECATVALPLPLLHLYCIECIDCEESAFGCVFFGVANCNLKGNNGIDDEGLQLWRDLQTTIFVNAPVVLQGQETPKPVMTGTPAVSMSLLALRVVRLAMAINTRGAKGLSEQPSEPDHRTIRSPPASVLLRGIVAAWVRGGFRTTDKTACEIFPELSVYIPPA